MICLLYIDCIASDCRFQFLDYSPLVFEKSWMYTCTYHYILLLNGLFPIGWGYSDILITGPYSVPPFLQCFLGAQTHSVLYVVGVHSMYCVTLTISFSVFGFSDFSLRVHRAETWSPFLSSLWGFLIHHQISLFLSEYNSQTSILFTCTLCILKN